MNSAMRWAIRFALFFIAAVAFTVGRPDTASAQVVVPVDLCGVGVGVLGSTSADCGGDTATPPSQAEPTAVVSTDQQGPDDSLGAGAVGDLVGDVTAVADVDASVPVNACGVGIGVLGDTSADCDSSQPAATPVDDGPTPVTAAPDPAPADTSDGGVVDTVVGDVVGDVDTTADADAEVPVGVCGIGVGVLGDSTYDCVAGSSVVAPPSDGPSAPSAPVTPVVPVLPAAPDVPALPADGLISALPLPITGNLVDRVISAVAAPVAALPVGSSSTGLQSLLGSTRSGLEGNSVGDQLAFTGSSTPFLMWLQLALIGGGVFLRGLAKALILR